MIRLKTPEQIEKIRRSARILVEVLQELSGMVKPGITPLDLDTAARKIIARHNAAPAFLGYMGFPAAICTSVNEAVIHGIPDKTPLAAGDVVGIDCGIVLDGYYSDSAVTIPVGKISGKVQKLLEVTRESLYLGIEQARAGNRLNDISRAIYRHTRNNGYGVVRPYCGHGVGLAIHEDPQVPNYVGSGPNPRLKPGMVLAIEPMVNLGTDDVRVLEDEWTVTTTDNSVSAHFEHTVAILEDRTEILTQWD